MSHKTDTLPRDWNEWRRQWCAWKAAHETRMIGVRSPFPGLQDNMLADENLGWYRVNGRTVELSAVTFPNLSERDERGFLKTYDVRYIGLTYADDGDRTAGPLVDSFAALETELGIVP